MTSWLSVQHSRWELLLAAPNFTSLKGFWGFYFSKNTLFLLILATDPLMATAAAFQHGEFTNPGSHWTVPAWLFHFVPTLFQDLRWLSRCSHLTPATPPANTGQVVLAAHFTLSLLFSCLANMLTKTWQKHLNPAGRRSGCAAAWIALRRSASLSCRWWKWSVCERWSGEASRHPNRLSESCWSEVELCSSCIIFVFKMPQCSCLLH